MKRMGMFSFLTFSRRRTLILLLTPAHCHLYLVTARAEKTPELTHLASVPLTGASLQQLTDFVQASLTEHRAKIRGAKVCVLLADEWCYVLSSPYESRDPAAHLQTLLSHAIPVPADLLASDTVLIGPPKEERSVQYIALTHTIAPIFQSFLTSLHLRPTLFEPLSLSYARELLTIEDRPQRCLFLEITKLRTLVVLVEKERVATSFVIPSKSNSAILKSVLDVAKKTHNIIVEKIYVQTQLQGIPDTFRGIPVEVRSFSPLETASALTHDSNASLLPGMKFSLLDMR